MRELTHAENMGESVSSGCVSDDVPVGHMGKGAPVCTEHSPRSLSSRSEYASEKIVGPGAPTEHAKSKLELIMGAEGVARLAAARVVVLGLGGVGSSCVEALARGGVGHLFLVDRDVVQESNINRQAIAFRSTLGRRKVDAMRAMVADINPDAQVETRHMLVQRDNLPALMEEVRRWASGEACDGAEGATVDSDGEGAEGVAAGVDAAGMEDDSSGAGAEPRSLSAVEDIPFYVIDALDSVSVKLTLAELAQQEGFPLISSMGAANKLHPECLRVADVYKTVNCPLCRIMRKEGRKRGIRHLRVLYSCEEPVRVPVREGADRSERSNLGTASFMPPIMGQMLAGAVIRELAGLEDAR